MILFIADPHAYGPGRTHIATWNNDRKQMIAWCQKLRPGDLIWPGHAEVMQVDITRAFDPKQPPTQVDCQRCAKWWRQGKRPITQPYEKEAPVATAPVPSPSLSVVGGRPPVQSLMDPERLKMPPGLKIPGVDLSRVRLEVVMADVAFAEWLLAKNVDNRPVHPSQVAKLKRAHAQGEFMLDFQAVLIDWNDRMINGQHRGLMIKETGLPAPLFIAWGMDPGIQKYLDQHEKRTAGDTLAMLGYSNANRMAAIARLAYLWDNGLFFNHGLDTVVPNQVIADFSLEHSDLLIYATTLAGATYRDSLIPPSPIGFAAYLLLQIDAQQAVDFFDALGTGAALPHGSPILALRKAALMLDGISKTKKIRTDATTYASMIVRTWNDVRQNKTRDQLRIAGSNGIIPCPKPV